MAGDSLPFPWKTRLSQTKQKVYYYNTQTKETRWDLPGKLAKCASQPERKRLAKKIKLAHLAEDDLRGSITRCLKIGGSSDIEGKNVLLEPWEHQVEAVCSLVENIAVDVSNRSYLLQHSTGSGKTMTMASLAYQLLYLNDNKGLKFHSVVIVLDRLSLNLQIGSAVETFLRRNGIDEVAKAKSVQNLMELLLHENSKQLMIITTIQKLIHLSRNKVLMSKVMHRNKKGSIDQQTYCRIALLVDEAHRSHGDSTRNMVESFFENVRGTNTFLSFVGFTATPSAECLRLFGTARCNSVFPFHCYPISQAISDQRIVNVLQKVICVKSCIETNIPQHELGNLRQKKIMRRILDHASSLENVLRSKASFILSHFSNLKHKMPIAKCMIVVRSRRDVVTYHSVLRQLVKNRKVQWAVFGALSSGIIESSGRQKDSEIPPNQTLVNENELNGHVSLELADIIIVCDKLDTGYNDPNLNAMYIDRFIRSSIHMVQLLSRLNRRSKEKTEVFIVDFSNHQAQIRRAFAEYWGEAIGAFGSETPISLRTLDKKMSYDILEALLIEPLGESLQSEDIVKPISNLIMNLERDQFLQLNHALTVHPNNEYEGNSFPKAQSQVRVLRNVKLAMERIRPSSAELTHLSSLEKSIKSRMNARIIKFSVTFSGQISPQDYLK